MKTTDQACHTAPGVFRPFVAKKENFLRRLEDECRERIQPARGRAALPPSRWGGAASPSGKVAVLPCLILFMLFILSTNAWAQSSNETFTIGINGQLRADHTNFFDTNIVQLTNALLKAGFSTGGSGTGPDMRPGSDVVSIWGDSLSDGGGTGGPWGLLMTNFIPSVAPDINAYSGQGSSYISNQFLLAPAQWGNITVLWAGRNDDLTVPANTNITVANLNYMATNVFDRNVIVLGVLVSTNDTRATISVITNLNNSLSNIYWPRYIDVEKMLMANNNGGAEDLAYVANNWTPFSLLASTDPLHLNASGYNLSQQCLPGHFQFILHQFRPPKQPARHGSQHGRIDQRAHVAIRRHHPCDQRGQCARHLHYAIRRERGLAAN